MRSTRNITAKISALFCLGLFIFTMLGCETHAACRYYGTQRYPAVPSEQVEVLRRRPQRDFTVIADFQSKNSSPKDMQKRAAEIGADAVIVSLLGGYYDSNTEWASEDAFSSTYSTIAGTAIKYK